MCSQQLQRTRPRKKIKQKKQRTTKTAQKPSEWIKVVFAADCIYEEWDEERDCPTCPECGGDYSECPCPGPMMEDEYDYKEINGVLFARKKS
jgi:hypothetical protein